MINYMKLIEILEQHNLVPNTLTDSSYCLEKREDKWIIKYETERGLFIAFETKLGSLKMVIPIHVYNADIPSDTLIEMLELNGTVEGSITKTTMGRFIILNYEREIPPHRLTEAPADICQIFTILNKELNTIRHYLESPQEDSDISVLEKLENSLSNI